MEKTDAIKANRLSLRWTGEDEEKSEGEGLTSLSNIQNPNNEFRSSNPEALKDIESNEDFKKDFNKFIDGILKFDDARKLADKYVRLMNVEAGRKERDPKYKVDDKAIEKAKQNFMNHPEIEALRKNKDFDLKTYELKIEKKFPKQMHEMKRLMNGGSAENRAKTLKDLGRRTGVEDEKIRQFIDKQYQIDVPETDEIWGEFDEETAKKMRGEKKFDGPKTSGEGKFKTTVDKDLRPLSDLFEKLVLDDEASRGNEIKELEKEYHQVKAFLKQWEGRDEAAVRNWAQRKKGQLQRGEFLEALAMMDQGNYLLTKGHRLRDPQIVAILIFMRSKENKGQLCQIQTGEGKTVIVSLLATMKVLQGKQVDVITSNQVLATEGVTSRKDFYELLGISVDSNNADENYKRGPRECYAADVVYGSIGNFQFDYLRDSFEGFETRGERKFDTVLLDEVDSMLIDNGGYVAKLAGPFPGIESLKYVYLKIWQELIKAVKGQGQGVDSRLTEKAEELNKDITLSEDELQANYESFQGKMLRSQTDEIKSKIKASNPANFFLIPNHLKSYAENSVDTWVDNAVYAYFDCNENEKYVIKEKDGENVIVPVDYQNTGVTLRNTIWSNGLHQFVQLKHNLHLTSETLTTCFISNVGYIKLYKNSMFGMTGTLGSTNEQKMLSKAYNVGYAKIPTYKEKKFSEFPGIVARDDHWHNTVTLQSFIMARKKRSVLIICETIKELRELEKNIKALKKLENFDAMKIRIYEDEDGSEVTEEKVGESEIIIATNIAGRGTDFKTTKELEAAGGLHVFVSFLPVNKRVEDQAFGRTARQGKSGTAQLIIKNSDVVELGMEITQGMTFEAVKEKRDQIEKDRLDNIENVELAEIDFQDEIFALFSELYSEFKEDNEKLFLTKDLKEFWAFWLYNKHYKGKNVKALNVFDEFESFKLEASVILGSNGGKGKISHNPYYSILEAESLLSVHNVNEAREALDNAIAIAEGNSDILISVPLKRFELAIESGCQLTQRFSKALKKVFLVDLFADIEKDEAYKASASVALEEAKKALEIEMEHMKKHIIEEGGSSEDFRRILIPVEKNLLLKHLYSRYLALQTFHEHVQSLAKQIDASGNTIGLALNSKVPDFFKEPVSEVEKKLKESMTEKELHELDAVGVEYFYGLREVHDVPDEIIRSAQGQIAAGIAALAAGILFPPSLPVVAPAAATLISEGVCDIVIELISKGNTGFDVASFVKGKVISYGISIATMGISAIATSVRILNQAVKTVKGLANLLRASPYFKKVCEKMAGACERFAALLDKTKNLKAFGKMNKAEQLEHLHQLELAGELEKLKALGGLEKLSKLKDLEKLGKLRQGMTKTQAFKEAFKMLGKETTEGVASTVVTEKIVTESLERVLESLKPKVHEMVKKTIDEKLEKDNLKLMEPEATFKLTSEILVGTYGEMTGEVFREIALGVLRHSKSWKAKVASLIADTGISLSEVFNYTTHFCEKFNEQSKGKVKNDKQPASTEVINESVNMIVDQVTEKIYGLIVNLAGKHAGTLVVNPLMSKVFHNSSDKKENDKKTSNDESERTRKFNELVDAYEVLGVKPGATVDEINKARRKAMLESHPDRNLNDPQAHEKAQKINEAFDLIMESIERKNNPNFTPPTTKLLTFSNEFPNIVKKNPEMAHRGNIKTLSDAANQHIVVNVVKENGKVSTVEFGKNFKDNGNETITLNYQAPTKDKLGHFVPTDSSIESQISSGPNSCFFDAYAAVANSHGRNVKPEDIRALAEQPSFYNTMYNGFNTVAKVLNNPLTKQMFNKTQREMMVGGSGSDSDKMADTPPMTASPKQVPSIPEDDRMGSDGSRSNSDIADPVHSKRGKNDDRMETGSSQENSPKAGNSKDFGDPTPFNLDKPVDNYNFKTWFENVKTTPLRIKSHSIGLPVSKSAINVVQDKSNYAILKVTHKIPKTDPKIKKETVPSLTWPKGKQAHFDNLVIDSLYSKSNQIKAFDRALEPVGIKGSDIIKGDFTLDRGHLAGKGDFFKIEDYKQTYNFLNVLPMWKKINRSGGNWFKVEEYVRKLAEHSDIKITIGSAGVMSLHGQDIYLAEQNRYPIPRFIYKIITKKDSDGKDEHEVFVFTNNPFERGEEIKKEVRGIFEGDLLEPLSDDVKDENKAYTFKVKYDKFIQKLPNLSSMKKHSIPWSEGEIKVLQDPTHLGIAQVVYDIPMSAGKKKEKIPTFPWPGGKLDDFGGLAVDKMYDETYQKTAIAKALTPTGAEKLVAHNYIDGEDFSFQRGHLGAKSDFLTIDDQKQTYNFLNVVPMWKTINQPPGNWRKAEDIISKGSADSDLDITVGTLGVMSLEGKEIYLEADLKKIPVPRYLFKFSTTETGANDVYVVFNNPHAQKNEVKAEVKEIFGSDTVEFSDIMKNGYAFTIPYAKFKTSVNSAFKGYELP